MQLYQVDDAGHLFISAYTQRGKPH